MMRLEWALLASAAALVLSPVALIGQSFDFTTPINSTTTGGSVDAAADFTVGPGTITVTLTDLEANPTDDAQLISDLYFTLGSGTYSGATLHSSSTQELTINSGGAYTLGSTGASATHWALSGSHGSYQLNDLTGGQPYNLIIGPPSSSNKYSAANPSITNHDPSLNQSAIFTLDITGVTSATTINGATFQFGTTAGSNEVTGRAVTVPEGGAAFLYLLLVGGVCFGAMRFRSRRLAQSLSA